MLDSTIERHVDWTALEEFCIEKQIEEFKDIWDILPDNILNDSSFILYFTDDVLYKPEHQNFYSEEELRRNRIAQKLYELLREEFPDEDSFYVDVQW